MSRSYRDEPAAAGLLGFIGIARAAASAGCRGHALDGYLGGLTTWSGDFTQAVQDTKGKGGGHWPRQARDRAARASSAGNPRRKVQPMRAAADRRRQEPLVPGSRPGPGHGEAAVRSVAAIPGHVAGGRRPTCVPHSNVQANGKRDGLDWVRALPKDAASIFVRRCSGSRARNLRAWSSSTSSASVPR